MEEQGGVRVQRLPWVSSSSACFQIMSGLPRGEACRAIRREERFVHCVDQRVTLKRRESGIFGWRLRGNQSPRRDRRVGDAEK